VTRLHKTSSGLVRLAPPPQRSPRLHEFLNQPWRRQLHHVPARVVRGLVECLQFVPWHRFELHAQCFEFGARELFDGRAGGPSGHAVHGSMFAVSWLQAGNRRNQPNEHNAGLSEAIPLNLFSNRQLPRPGVPTRNLVPGDPFPNSLPPVLSEQAGQMGPTWFLAAYSFQIPSGANNPAPL
jgi:hypothetical protein